MLFRSRGRRGRGVRREGRTDEPSVVETESGVTIAVDDKFKHMMVSAPAAAGAAAAPAAGAADDAWGSDDDDDGW